MTMRRCGRSKLRMRRLLVDRRPCRREHQQTTMLVVLKHVNRLHELGPFSAEELGTFVSCRFRTYAIAITSSLDLLGPRDSRNSSADAETPCAEAENPAIRARCALCGAALGTWQILEFECKTHVSPPFLIVGAYQHAQTLAVL